MLFAGLSWSRIKYHQINHFLNVLSFVFRLVPLSLTCEPNFLAAQLFGWSSYGQATILSPQCNGSLVFWKDWKRRGSGNHSTLPDFHHEDPKKSSKKWSQLPALSDSASLAARKLPKGLNTKRYVPNSTKQRAKLHVAGHIVVGIWSAPNYKNQEVP